MRTIHLDGKVTIAIDQRIAFVNADMAVGEVLSAGACGPTESDQGDSCAVVCGLEVGIRHLIHVEVVILDIEAEDATCRWTNLYEAEEARVRISIDIDYPDTGEHFQETFYEYSYPLQTVLTLLERYGFRAARLADGEDFGPVRADSPRWIITAVKQYTQEEKE